MLLTMDILQPEVVVRDKSSHLDPSCNIFGPSENLSCRCEQVVSDARYLADEANHFDSCGQNRRYDGNSKTGQKPSEFFNPSAVLRPIAERESSFSHSPIKYVLSYRDQEGRRFKDKVVQHQALLEPFSHNQREWILEVTRIVMMQEMHIDSTKPFAEQSIAVEQYGPCEVKLNSVSIINALNSVINYWPGLILNTPSMIIREPFAFLYHHRKVYKNMQIPSPSHWLKRAMKDVSATRM